MPQCSVIPSGIESIGSSNIDDRLQRVLSDMRSGNPVVLVDNFDREDEGDLILAAEKVSAQTMALLIRECSGIVCLCLEDEKLSQLDLPLMVADNQSRFQTAFTVTIDARQGITTGVSAQDRTATVRAAIAPHAQPNDLVRPGHVFPLRAMPGGILARQGHTEGAVELARMAGLMPAAVLCELTNPDGTMTKGDNLRRFATNHNMAVLSIAELVECRQRGDSTQAYQSTGA